MNDARTYDILIVLPYRNKLKKKYKNKNERFAVSKNTMTNVRTYIRVNVQNILELYIFPNAGACNELL